MGINKNMLVKHRAQRVSGFSRADTGDENKGLSPGQCPRDICVGTWRHSFLFLF